MSTMDIPPRTLTLERDSYTIEIEIAVEAERGRTAYAIDKANQIEDAIETIAGATRSGVEATVVGGLDEYGAVTVDHDGYQIDVGVSVSNPTDFVNREAERIVSAIEEISTARRVSTAVKRLEASGA